MSSSGSSSNSSSGNSSNQHRRASAPSSQEPQQGTKQSCIYMLQKSRRLGPVVNILGLVAWMFTMAGTFHCSFIMIQQQVPLPSTLAPADSSTSHTEHVNHPIGLGLFSTSVYDTEANLLGCVSYYGTSDEFDGAFRAARTFGLIAALSTTVALICVSSVTLFVNSLHHKVNLWSVARFLFFTAFLCELLTFLAFGRDLCNRTDMECRPGSASILTVFNLFLLLSQSALIYIVPPAKKPVFLLRKERLLSELGGGAEAEDSAKFEILSKGSSTRRKQQKHADDASDLAGLDLESECGTQEENMIMEGIECVAADQLRRVEENTSNWDKLIQRYQEIGTKKSTRRRIAGLLLISWVFTIVGTTRCTFILVGATGQERNEFSGLGLFNRAYYMHDDILGCIAYPSAAKSDFDAAFEVGRAFGMLTLLLVTASFVSFVGAHGFFEYSHPKELAWWCLTQLTLPCALLSQMITFSAFETQACTQSTNVDCVPGVAAIFAILNVFLLIPLAIFVFALPCPQKSFFRLRKKLPALFARSSTNKSKFSSKQQQSRQSKKGQRKDTVEDRLPEPSSTHSVSEHSNDGGVRRQNFVPHTPGGGGAINESVEVRETASKMMERDGVRTPTMERSHTEDASFTSDQMTPPNPTTEAAKSVAVNSDLSYSLTASAMPSTSTSGGPTLTQSTSWDSGVSVEQFETVDMDSSNDSGSKLNQRTNIIERNVLAARSKAAAANKQDASVKDAKCCTAMVESTAMSILNDMKREDDQKQGQQQQRQSQKKLPPTVRSLRRKPSPHPKHTPNNNNRSHSPERSFVPRSISYSEEVQTPRNNDDDPSPLYSTPNTSRSLPNNANANTISGGGGGGRPSASEEKVRTPRGGRFSPWATTTTTATTSSDIAVGEPTLSSSDTVTYTSSSKNTPAEGSTVDDDDGITFNTGDAIKTEDTSVAARVDSSIRRLKKVFV